METGVVHTVESTIKATDVLDVIAGKGISYAYNTMYVFKIDFSEDLGSVMYYIKDQYNQFIRNN